MSESHERMKAVERIARAAEEQGVYDTFVPSAKPKVKFEDWVHQHYHIIMLISMLAELLLLLMLVVREWR